MRGQRPVLKAVAKDVFEAPEETTDEALLAFAAEKAQTLHNPTSTCAIGSASQTRRKGRQ